MLSPDIFKEYDPAITPGRVLFSHADDRSSYVRPYRSGSPDTAGLFAGLLLLNPTGVCAVLDDTDDAFDLVIELGTDPQKP